MTPSFSPFALKGIVDVVSGGSGSDPTPPIGIYRTGPAIEQLMLDCNLDFRIAGGSRVPTLLQFLRDIAQQPDGSESLVRVVERVCDPRDYGAVPQAHAATVEHLNTMLGPDGWEVADIAGRWTVRRIGAAGAVVSHVSAKAALLDFDTVARDIQRALASVEQDPEDAVTAGCSIIESVCRTILSDLELPLPPKKDVDGLMRAVQEPLGLKPSRSDLPAEIANDIRQILGGLTSTVLGIGALRTHGGDAHGRERGAVRIDARIARLALHSASTAALFLIETWERKFKRALPKAEVD